MTINFESFMVTLSAALAASIVVERVLEILKNIMDHMIGTENKKILPDLKEVDKKIAKLETISKAAASDEAWDEKQPLNTILVEPATDPDDGTVLRTFVIQVMGFAVGIITAHYFELGLFRSLMMNSVTISPWSDFLLTGLLIGGGSGPIHTLIRFVTQRKEWVPVAAGAESNPDAAKKTAVISTPETPVALVQAADIPAADELNVPYNGGVDLEILEYVHKRTENPGMIIYHHTTMNSKSTFEDVVRVIKSRTDSKGNHWLTGYNCVIMADGAIKPFCRWDRYGNHAEGYNKKSLGISFNGNFETAPNIPFSNPDGRYGASRPTEAQLRAGARVTALWTFLYNIPVDFTHAIIPHSQVANKSCPGSNFPHDEFKKWLEYYRKCWQKSPEMMERIEAFKLKPYLYVK